MTTPDATLERLRHAFAEDTSAAGADCPTAGRLWEGVNGGLEPADAEALADHLSSCGACAEAWRIARELQAVEAPSVVPFVRERRPSAVWPLLAAAATIALAVAAWQVLRPATLNAPAPLTVAAPPKPEQTSASIGPAIEKAPVILSASHALVFRNPTAADPFVEEFAAAIEPYKKDDYPEAITRLDALARKYPDADEPPLYLGVSLLLASRRGDAVAPLQRAAKGRDAVIAEHARRYLTLATAK